MLGIISVCNKSLLSETVINMAKLGQVALVGFVCLTTLGSVFAVIRKYFAYNFC